MQASECCIVRASLAAILGALAAFALLWKHGFLVAAVVSPLFGSTAAVAAAALFWLVSLLIPRLPRRDEPVGTPPLSMP